MRITGQWVSGTGAAPIDLLFIIWCRIFTNGTMQSLEKWPILGCWIVAPIPVVPGQAGGSFTGVTEATTTTAAATTTATASNSINNEHWKTKATTNPINPTNTTIPPSTTLRGARLDCKTQKDHILVGRSGMTAKCMESPLQCGRFRAWFDLELINCNPPAYLSRFGDAFCMESTAFGARSKTHCARDLPNMELQRLVG